MNIDEFNPRRNASWLWGLIVATAWVFIIAGLFTGILLCVRGKPI
ncbi:hypothetical protein [Bradyrhizobium arachidis]|nr:hypothetical protein [Bradyrhizobium arachidis]